MQFPNEIFRSRVQFGKKIAANENSADPILVDTKSKSYYVINVQFINFFE
jgi:hypothetical protein